MTSTAARPKTELDAAYRARRLALNALVTATVARAFALQRSPKMVIPIVEAGQRHTVALVDAYMAAKLIQATGQGTVLGLDPSRYTTHALRKVAAEAVYGRALTVLEALNRTDQERALVGAQAAIEKLVRTDLQLAQTHAARDWMTEHDAKATDETRIVGYRRVLTGPGPHCGLCTAAASRTYRISDLMPIHEHCGCTVEPLWGEHDVAAVGTTVRVEIDPELGPRLMAEDWSSVGPRLL